MNIKVYTARGLAISSITGIVLGTGLLFGYRSLESELHQLGPNSITIQQTSNLRSQLGWYLTATDLVLRDNESHMLNATLRQSEQLIAIVKSIQDAQLADEKNQQLPAIANGIRNLQKLVDEAAAARGDDRISKVGQIASRADAIAAPLVQQVDDLKTRLERRARYHTEDLENKQLLLRIMTVIAAIAFIVVVLMSWLWSVHAIVRPIERLSTAAEEARLHNAAFLVDESGPEEVIRLTRNISTFVSTRADFLATMSHELRTPLNGIINLNELMLETDLDDGQREFVRSAMSAGEALLSLINDILDFSKLQAQKVELEQTPFDIRSMVDGTTEILGGLADNKSLDLEAIVHHLVPVSIAGDAARLRQILMNLMNNALKFTETGHVVLEVTAIEETMSDVCLLFCIKDSGIGISEEARTNLFQAFQQGDTSTTRKFGGTGLGLVICKELAELMGGNIGVESEPGVGSTFWFTIRALRDPDGTREALPETSRKKRVLLISDRELVRTRLQQQLLSAGMIEERVLIANSTDDINEITDLSDENTWAILDPYRSSAALDDMIEGLRSVCPSMRIGILEHPNRSQPSKPSAKHEKLETILEPTRMDGIRDWLFERNIQHITAGDAPDLPTSQTSTADETSTDAVRAKARILVAEDNTINQKVIGMILRKHGFDAVIVNNGQEAVDYLQENVVNLVLMDCQMPVLDGWEATETIRELEAVGRLSRGMPSPLPIVALTANAMPGDRKRCLDSGMNEYLTKPLRPKKVLTAIDALIATTTSND